MGEAPADKRARVLSAGPRRKRETPAAAAQQRAYKKPERRKKLDPVVREIQEKCHEIKRLEESIRLVGVMRADRNRPLHEAQRRLITAENELRAATEHLKVVEAKGQADMSDLDERESILMTKIDNIKTDIAYLHHKIAIDASGDGSVESGP